MAKKDPDPVRLAERRIKKIKDFYAHLWSFILSNAFLLALNLLTSPGFLWALIPLLGWTVGLAFHAFDVFGYPGMGKDWEERMMEREIRRYQDRAGRLGLPEPEPEKEEQLDLPPLEKKKQADTLYKDEDLV
jgi:hypothetical protein